jgi:shikimate dehydrogenase
MKAARYGLIGKSLSHSFSQNYFTEKFKHENINASYELFELSAIEDFTNLLVKHPDLKGLNVTIPYKEQIIPFLTSITEEAKEIRAVNTVKIERSGRNFELSGYNTDVIGFRESLIPPLNSHHNKALVLGFGGASKAVTYVLKQMGIEYIIVNRKNTPSSITYNQMNKEIMDEFNLIINTTPLGLYPDIDSAPEIPYEFLSSKHLLYDLVYNPELTLFLKRGKLRGATIKNGIEMLHIQAEASWKIWNGNNV